MRDAEVTTPTQSHTGSHARLHQQRDPGPRDLSDVVVLPIVWDPIIDSSASAREQGDSLFWQAHLPQSRRAETAPAHMELAWAGPSGQLQRLLLGSSVAAGHHAPTPPSTAQQGSQHKGQRVECSSSLPTQPLHKSGLFQSCSSVSSSTQGAAKQKCHSPHPVTGESPEPPHTRARYAKAIGTGFVRAELTGRPAPSSDLPTGKGPVARVLERLQTVRQQPRVTEKSHTNPRPHALAWRGLDWGDMPAGEQGVLRAPAGEVLLQAQAELEVQEKPRAEPGGRDCSYVVVRRPDRPQLDGVTITQKCISEPFREVVDGGSARSIGQCGQWLGTEHRVPGMCATYAGHVLTNMPDVCTRRVPDSPQDPRLSRSPVTGLGSSHGTDATRESCICTRWQHRNTYIPDACTPMPAPSSALPPPEAQKRWAVGEVLSRLQETEEEDHAASYQWPQPPGKPGGRERGTITTITIITIPTVTIISVIIIMTIITTMAINAHSPIFLHHSPVAV
ncbi:hypothetical protein TREES_T100000868 [Tupaia chinensis]|uniref:Uncharacterized protein n=1 Tax=Tupaia chinensis TaxID=246437 RepID=L9JIU0_TUPCH|nr:hypothetical protein TREES_T100000868 [Tupaia chinensis]